MISGILIYSSEFATINTQVISACNSLGIAILSNYNLHNSPTVCELSEVSNILETSIELLELEEDIIPPESPVYERVMHIGSFTPMHIDKRPRIEHLTQMRVKR